MPTKDCYKLLYCPRYAGEEALEDRVENMRLQKSLWNAINFISIRDPLATVELRFQSNPVDQAISVFLVVSNSAKDFSDAFARLLPLDYEWTPCPEGPDTGTSWNECLELELVRRVEYFNLPVAYPWFLNGGVSSEGIVDGASGMENLSNVETLPSSQRQLPLIGVPKGLQLKSRPVCIPLLGTLSEEDADRRHLCVEMQAAAPASVSFIVRAPRTEQLNNDRVHATLFHRCLEPYAHQLSGAGYGSYLDLCRNYDRYWMPADYLCQLSIRVSAPDQYRLRSVAHALAAEFGGMRAFEIVPTTTFEGLTSGGGDRVAGQHGYSEVLLERLRSQLEMHGVVENSKYNQFLMRMPQLYTLDEAQMLLRLPIAGEKGLPGIESRLAPPFYLCRNEYVAQHSGDAVTIGKIALARGSETSGRPTSSDSPQGARASDELSVPLSRLAKHALVVGNTGSGKTTAVCNLLRQLGSLDVPFLVVEPSKSEYWRKLKGLVPNLQRFRFAGDEAGNPVDDYLAFDPMRLPKGVSVCRHVSYLKACFQAAMPLSDSMAIVLENGLLDYYTAAREAGGCGLRLWQQGGVRAHTLDPNTYRVVPSLEHFSMYFRDYLERTLRAPEGSGKGRGSDWVEQTINAFKRRFDLLLNGPIGVSAVLADRAFQNAMEETRNMSSQDAHELLEAHYNPVSELWKGQAVVELDGLADNSDKSLLMAFLFTFLFEFRQAEDSENREAGEALGENLRHLLVLEEAHRILGRDQGMEKRGSDTVGMGAQQAAQVLFCNLLAEIRAYGQGIAVVEQIPGKIVSDVVKNTNLRIMLRLSAEDDRDYLGQAMNFTEAQKRFVTTLTPGRGVVFEEGLDEPVLLHMPSLRRRVEE